MNINFLELKEFAAKFDGTILVMGILDKSLPSMLPELISNELLYKPIAFESLTDSVQMGSVFRGYYNAAYVAMVLYGIFVFVGPRVMKNRAALELKAPLANWNLFLAVFSFLGYIRVLPVFLGIVGSSLTYSVCYLPNTSFFIGASGFWGALFSISKYFELMDTVFLVLRKKEVPFLHWFHHMTVLLYAWDAGANSEPIAVWFCVMNYFVHTIMYFYYYLAAVGKPPRWGMSVTFLQISQMFAGCFVVGLSLLSIHKYGEMHRVPSVEDVLAAGVEVEDVHSPTAILMPLHNVNGSQEKYLRAFGCGGSMRYTMGGVFIYGSYLFLFVKFAMGKYFNPKKKEKKAI